MEFSNSSLLTSSRSHGVHGGHGIPLIPVRVVALAGAEPVGPVKTSHGVKQPVDDRHTNPNAPRQHGSHQLPLVLFWIIPAGWGKKGDVLDAFPLKRFTFRNLFFFQRLFCDRYGWISLSPEGHGSQQSGTSTPRTVSAADNIINIYPRHNFHNNTFLVTTLFSMNIQIINR